jgi:hypothetical protein
MIRCVKTKIHAGPARTGTLGVIALKALFGGPPEIFRSR